MVDGSAPAAQTGVQPEGGALRKRWVLILMFGWASFCLGQGCRNYAAQQYNSMAGFYVAFQNQSASDDTPCRLQNASPIFGIDTPAGQPHIQQTGGWQLNTEYTAVGSTSGDGTFSMTLTDVVVGPASGTFVPLDAPVEGNVIPSYAAQPAEYVVVVDDVRIQGGQNAKAHLSA